MGIVSNSEQAELTDTNATVDKLQAKKVSLVAKIVAGVLFTVGVVLKFLGIFTCTIEELSIAAFTIVGIFGTVDMNIALDKFTRR